MNEDKRYFVIKDHRDGELFIDDQSYVRNFESVVKSFRSLEEAKAEFPDALLLVT